jgi:hypothetical protein
VFTRSAWHCEEEQRSKKKTPLPMFGGWRNLREASSRILTGTKVNGPLSIGRWHFEHW